MRDVSPSFEPKIDFKSLINYFISFCKNPIEKISSLPDWNWLTLFSFHIILAISSGILSGIVGWNIYYVASGIFLMPVVSTLSVFLLTLFFYYYFQFFEKKTHSFRKLFTLVALASVPFYLFQIMSHILSVISLIGFAFTSFLGIVGLCDNFGMEKKRAYKLVAFVFLMVFLAWLKQP